MYVHVCVFVARKGLDVAIAKAILKEKALTRSPETCTNQPRAGRRERN
jgi:hypothetical protein